MEDSDDGDVSMLVVTLGDPYGVTIELLADALRAGGLAGPWPVVLVGSNWHWQDQLRRLGHSLGTEIEITVLRGAQAASELLRVRGSGLYFVDVGSQAGEAPAETLTPVIRGELAVGALHWLRELEAARRATSVTTPLAVVTGPIDKYAAGAAAFGYPGQTEFFAALWQSQAIMILAGPKLRVGLVTNHLALRDVAKTLSSDLICAKAILLARSIRSTYGIERPRLAITGLNPHASDGGLFGDEEHQIIAPAVQRAQTQLGLEATLTGPLPADTAFYRGYRGDFDAVLAMYHDQGLGPLKTVHFDDAVNVSGGLKHFRASPDHGPAADIFLRRQASPASMTAAIKLAADYLHKFGENTR